MQDNPQRRGMVVVGVISVVLIALCAAISVVLWNNRPDGISLESHDPEPTRVLPTSRPTTVVVEVDFEPVGADFDGDLPEGDTEHGAALFNNEISAPDGVVFGCLACHSLDGSITVGPSMQGITERIPDGYDLAEDYVVEAILRPSEFVNEGFNDLMPKNFGQRLDEQSLADLVAFILEQ